MPDKREALQIDHSKDQGKGFPRGERHGRAYDFAHIVHAKGWNCR